MVLERGQAEVQHRKVSAAAKPAAYPQFSGCQRCSSGTSPSGRPFGKRWTHRMPAARTPIQRQLACFGTQRAALKKGEQLWCLPKAASAHMPSLQHHKGVGFYILKTKPVSPNGYSAMALPPCPPTFDATSPQLPPPTTSRPPPALT